MNVMYATDRNYVSICGVSVFSLLVNNQFEHINIYIFEKDLREEKERFFSLSERFDVSFKFIDVAAIEKMCIDLEIPLFRGGYMAYARLFADRYISGSRVIYLDCDTLVVGSLEELWNYDMKGQPVAAVIDCIHSLANIFIGKKENDNYFNSGVILFDYTRWKEEKCLEKIEQSLKTVDISKTATYGDQDILNHAIGDKFCKLPLNYNEMYITRYFSPQKTYTILGRNEKSYYSKLEILNARNNPYIIHYAGRELLRPWSDNTALSEREKELWLKYKNNSSWKDYENINNRVNWVILKCIHLYLKKTPFLFCWIHGVLKKYSLRRRIEHI